MERFARADSWIHDLLIERSENEYVKYLMDKIHFHVARYRAISFEVSSNVEESTQQHLDLLECMKRRDQEEFKDKISAHIQWSYKILQNNLNGL